MNRIAAWALLAAMAGLSGCGSDGQATSDVDLIDPSTIDRALVQTHQVKMIDNGIIRQHTLYAYHFIENSAQLNSLGQRDVGVLGRHFSRYPGHLNVRRGGMSDQLYDARVASVVAAMASHGVDTSRVEVGDGLPGGDGLPSGEVVIIYRGMTDPDSSRGGSSYGGSMAPSTSQ